MFNIDLIKQEYSTLKVQNPSDRESVRLRYFNAGVAVDETFDIGIAGAKKLAH